MWAGKEIILGTTLGDGTSGPDRNKLPKKPWEFKEKY
jgi:hypothetical protein